MIDYNATYMYKCALCPGLSPDRGMASSVVNLLIPSTLDVSSHQRIDALAQQAADVIVHQRTIARSVEFPTLEFHQ